MEVAAGTPARRGAMDPEQPFEDAPGFAFLLPLSDDPLSLVTPSRRPVRTAAVHWVARRVPPLEAGTRDSVCQTINDDGVTQPMPRPYAKPDRGGHSARRDHHFKPRKRIEQLLC